ncbi:transporter, hydrophobe/amphiphile efflux-1 (HAE1) family [Aminomonas paucivorans DSM 12260]|uniref:Transporter, hydrophobe/amphiphile efflux-1 (HAE1) family n=1 Tax=Aminomonas paucivorans DSM 12260 TaxID=584708 RepID=E3D0Y6_9BACT|nr:multidrug efflux RND transporter permease subunit [Aminomonas paucivorans]EFQ23068.1 transporter, hydrophobe/amphiphile efflux-1 (HAE1) family [Aminomonas paucivorans DSM 12260]
MFSALFIRRPILASVLSIVILLAGGIAMVTLPVAQFPDIVPPQVQVSAVYPGADPEVIAQTVASPLENRINGVDDMIYMNSVSSGSGAMTLNVTFAIGTDPDQATINVNNRVQMALSSLPDDVRRYGVTVQKVSPNMLLMISLNSPDGRYDTIYLNNYALVNLVDDMKRIPGVGDAVIYGSKDYAMRVWLRPDRLAQLKLTPSDVIQVIQEQNSQFAVGRLGQKPTEANLDRNFLMTTRGRLSTPEEFENIILRANPDGTVLYLRDVARVELGAKEYNFDGTMNGKPTIPIGIMLAPGANALKVADLVKEKLAELSQRFPQGVVASIPYDTTEFVRISIEEVVKTLMEAMVLVFLVVFLFLQNWRATLIPCLAVPVSIVGTFAGMKLFGFSINTLTLFGMVLAIGIVVDDAIVVLENVDRHMEEDRLAPKEAALKAMEEVTGPVIAIVLVLASVFVPVAFMGGMTGQMYKQFAITLSVSVVISGFVALTLTPALCGILLKPRHGDEKFVLFRKFNEAFESLTRSYSDGVRFLLRHVVLALGIVLALGAATAGVFRMVPSALVPDEDQGYAMAMVRLGDGISLNHTEKVVRKFDAVLAKDPLVKDTMTFAGYNMLSGTLQSNYGTSFIMLKDWKERPRPDQSSFAFVKNLLAKTWGIPEGQVWVFNPPPISGLSNTGGFEGYLQDRSGGDALDLGKATKAFLEAAAKRPEVTGLRTTFAPTIPQMFANLDRNRARALGVPINQVFATMASTFGSYYVNDFDKLGRTFQVLVQSDAPFRDRPDDLRYVYVRSNKGDMIPLLSLLDLKPRLGPEVMERFNAFPAASVTGDPAPGYTSGQAIQAMEEVAREVLPKDYTLAWTGSAYQEQETGSATVVAFGLGIIMVFLILAAQYEKWSLPLAVVLAVPFALFGAILAVWLRGLANDIYFQIALVTLIGLASKNAILIVEFALMRHQQGLSLFEAAAEAAHLRFRPIIMTSLAFILGCLPLMLSTGAGSASRHSIGTAVVGGMLAATGIAIFFIPSFFELIMKATHGIHGEHDPAAPADGSGEAKA